MKTKTTDEEMIQMCRNFKLLREQRGLSVRELSKASGVSEHIISNLENEMLGKGANTGHIFKLCAFFEIKARNIFSPLK